MTKKNEWLFYCYIINPTTNQARFYASHCIMEDLHESILMDSRRKICLIQSAFTIFGRHQVPSNELSHAKQVLLEKGAVLERVNIIVKSSFELTNYEKVIKHFTDTLRGILLIIFYCLFNTCLGNFQENIGVIGNVFFLFLNDVVNTIRKSNYEHWLSADSIAIRIQS